VAPELAPDPIIVYGAPRSGTTYLQALLSAHPEVFISDETRLFAWLHHALALTEDDRMVLGHREAFVRHLRERFPQLIRDFYRGLAPDARHWGDKNPHYADPFNDGCLELIEELFPQSMFIHIVRDGRDVVSSLLRKDKDGKPWVTFDQAHFTWSRHIARGSAFGRTLPRERFFELRYEELVADDVAMAGDIFGFLGIELHPAVEAFCRSQREKRTPFKGPTRNLEEGITVSEWSKYFSAEEQARSLELIGSDLVRHGYESEENLARLRERAAAALASSRGEASQTATAAEG
jgi:Sulfotransferase family